MNSSGVGLGGIVVCVCLLLIIFSVYWILIMESALRSFILCFSF